VNAVIYHSYDDIRIENRPIPSITDSELLVQVHGCGLCGSDILKIAQQAPPPVVLGHELTGTIIEKGRTVSNFEVGQRVVVAHHVPCGTCHYCRHQNYSMCADFKASNIDPCGFAEYIRVPAQQVQHMTLLLPETLGAEEASFTEPLACCVRAVRRTPLLDGDTVVVIGSGSVGLLMVQALKAIETGYPAFKGAHRARRGGGGGGMGREPLWPPARGIISHAQPARGRRAATRAPSPPFPTPAPTDLRVPLTIQNNVRVYSVDLIPERLQLARELGADDAFLAPPDEQGLRAILDSYTEGRGADAVILTVPGAGPFMQALAAVRKGGTVNIFAAHTGTAPISLETIYQQELTITSTYSSSPEELRIALDLLANRKVQVDRLISHCLPLAEFSEGVALMRKRAALKVYFQIAGESQNGKYTV
jgi:threonine dehydrogenase-like Zn-dependent dehydrogenase